MDIKVMADFCSSGLWNLKNYHMVDYDELGIPEELQKEIEDWIEFYDSEATERPSYCVRDEKAEELHKKGRTLARKIKALFPNRRVEYWAEMSKNSKEIVIKEEITL